MNNKSKFFMMNICVPLAFSLLCICMVWVMVCLTFDTIRSNSFTIDKQIYNNEIKDEFILNEITVYKKTKPKTKIRKIVKKRQDINLDFNILSKSGYTSDDLRRSLSTDIHKNMTPYVDIFIEAENRYGVNALYLMSKLGLESGWCKYKSGANNIAGWTDGKGSYRNFDSVEACIMHVAYTLSTFYKREVGTRLEDVCILYCPDEGYVDEVINIMKERERIINMEL